jgi:putative ABC transport system permease protein
MNNKEVLKSSFRIMKRNKMRTFYMVFGIIIGITSLSLTFTIGKGSQKQITERAKKYFGPSDIIVRAEKLKLDGKPVSSDLVSSLTIEDLKAISDEVPAIRMFDPVQLLSGQEVIAGNKNISATIKGSSVNGQFIWNRGVALGEYFNDSEELNATRVAVIGPGIAEELFGKSNPVGDQLRIGNIPFIVKGVLEPKGVDPHGNDLDMDIIVPITTLMKRMMNVDYILMGKFVLADENRMKEAVAGITATLNERHHLSGNGSSDYSILTPTFVQEKIREMTRVFNVFLPLISLIALLAAGIVIVVLMLMSVNDRVSEIGLRKAVGARSKDISIQFLIEISATSLFGGIIGMVIGLSFFKMFGMMMHLPFYIPWQNFVIGIILPVLLGVISGLVPARKAANLDPVVALS